MGNYSGDFGREFKHPWAFTRETTNRPEDWQDDGGPSHELPVGLQVGEVSSDEVDKKLAVEAEVEGLVVQELGSEGHHGSLDTVELARANHSYHVGWSGREGGR